MFRWRRPRRPNLRHHGSAPGAKSVRGERRLRATRRPLPDAGSAGYPDRSGSAFRASGQPCRIGYGRDRGSRNARRHRNARRSLQRRPHLRLLPCCPKKPHKPAAPAPGKSRRDAAAVCPADQRRVAGQGYACSGRRRRSRRGETLICQAKSADARSRCIAAPNGLREKLPAFYAGRTVVPISASSIARAAWRPSRIAQTTSDWPRLTSPAAHSLSTLVR